nr:elongation factor P [candidate division Zixibacteria bacterium]
MITAGEIRKGKKIMYEGGPYTVVDFMHVKMGRGRPHVKAKMKHLITGQVIEKSFLTTESFDEPDLENRTMQYLYCQDNEYFFMDSGTFEQIQIDSENLGDTRWYLMENTEYTVLLFEGKPISVDLPASVVLTVMETEPAVKGDTVTNVMKPAKVETGYEVKVPLFVKEGDKIKIDTRTGEYIERAN